MPLARGTRLGPYEIVAPLGAGGMGEVYRARDTRLGREVAVKVLPAEMSDQRKRLRRFELEARAATSLNHPNIVTIHDFGSFEGCFYIAMERVDGQTLSGFVRAAPLPPRRILDLGAQIADGLAKAHAAGIVHRDLKPANLMVTTDGFVKILDFGLAKLVPTTAEDVSMLPTAAGATEPGTVLGTVGYMSPEQAGGRPIDYRSDQFSLGAILYEMATGRRAFSGPTAAQTLAAVIESEPEPIARLNPGIPPPLCWVVERCLAKDPRDRYASTDDLAKDLQALRNRLSELFLPAAVPLPAPRKIRVRPGILAGAGVIIIALAAAAGSIATHRA